MSVGKAGHYRTVHSGKLNEVSLCGMAYVDDPAAKVTCKKCLGLIALQQNPRRKQWAKVRERPDHRDCPK